MQHDVSDNDSLRLQTLQKDDYGDEMSSDAEEVVKLNKTEINEIVNPNTIFVFLDQINDILLDYFGAPLSPIKLEANFDIVCSLMQELVEGGFPYITDINSLQELVPFKSSFTGKLLSSTNQLAKSYSPSASHSSLLSLSNSTLESSKTPWRKPNVKYTNNELYVDITEEIIVLLTHHKSTRSKYSNKLVPSIAVLKGKIEFTSHLSGVPDIQLNLSLNGHYLGIPAFHRCIRTDRWIGHEGSLSFIPPDGKTTIMNYTIDLDQCPVSKVQRSLGLITADFKEGLGPKKNEFEITLTLNLYKNVSKVDNLKVSIKTSQDENLKILRLSHGDFQTKSNGKFEWVFDQQTSLGINPVLRGTIETESDDEEQTQPKFPTSISLSYSNKGSLPSGIRVDSLKIVRGLSDVKPYKGVKYITKTSDFIIR